MERDPEVKMLLRLKKSFLIIKAKELGLATNGNKLCVARRIVLKQTELSSRLWDSIAGRK